MMEKFSVRKLKFLAFPLFEHLLDSFGGNKLNFDYLPKASNNLVNFL